MVGQASTARLGAGAVWPVHAVCISIWPFHCDCDGGMASCSQPEVVADVDGVEVGVAVGRRRCRQTFQRPLQKSNRVDRRRSLNPEGGTKTVSSPGSSAYSEGD